METMNVPVEVMEKVVKFIGATKVAFEKSSAAAPAADDIEKAVGALTRHGFVPADKQAALAEQFATNPAHAYNLITKFAEDATAERERAEAAVKEAKEAKASDEDAVAPIGTPDAGKSGGKSASSKKESDLAWERGFQL